MLKSLCPTRCHLSLHVILPVCLVAILGGSFQLPAADYKISPQLMKQLTEDENAAAPFFVVFGERPSLAPAYRMNYQSRGAFVVRALQQIAARSQAGVRAFLNSRNVRFTPFWVENKIYVSSGSLELARALAARPDVAALIHEEIFRLPDPQAAPAAATSGVPWNISQIHADQVWPTARGAGIVVANIDTGVQYNHPALVNQYRGYNGSSFDHTGNWSDPTGLCGSTPCDTGGHGTHTMGTMVGDDGNGNQIGVAPAARWIACKGCASSSCSSSALASCAQWVMDPLGNNGASGRPHVVNNSWGGSGGSTWYQGYVRNWVAAGIFPAFSIGNSGPTCGTAGSPGDYPESFASGAVSSTGVIASFSSRGPSKLGGIKPDIAAPGVGVRSSVPTDAYASYSGTSMASPHSAGAVALFWSAAPGYLGKISNTEQIILNSASPVASSENCGGISGSPNNTYGYGLLDVYQAVLDAGAGAPPANTPPVVDIVNPDSNSSHPCGVTVTFTATAADNEEGSISSISWTDNGQPMGSASTVTKTYSCSQAGSHAIAASAKDSKDLSGSDAITITIYDGSIPAAPSSLKASVSGAVVTLTWSDNSTNEDGFRVEYKSKTLGWSPAVTVGTDVKTATHSPGKGNYSYRVLALKGDQASAPSNVANARVK